MPRTSKYAAVYDLFLRCHRLLERRVENTLKSTDLHVPSYRVLDLAYRSPGMTLGQITEELLVTGGDIAGISSRLVNIGLLRPERDKEDRRIVRAEVTAEGRRRLHRAGTAVEETLVEALRGMSIAQAAALGESLDGIAKKHTTMN